jgi:anti-sigma regulatory factor (Ser/Thr protein kinase)
MLINLPRRLNRDTMYVLLQKVISKDKNPIADEITLNFETLSVFIEPSGVTILSNLIHWLESKGVTVMIIPGEVGIYDSPNKFLDDSMFFKEHLGEMISERSQVRSTTLPLMQVNAEKPMDWLINEFIPWLSRQLGVQADRLETIRVCMEEILNNIRDHADKVTGCIFAQYIPANHEVLISISDFGVGIPYNVQKAFPSMTDNEAIRKSVERGFSTLSRPHNRGVGLDNLIHNVVINGKGSVHIHSLNGILSCLNGNNEILYRSRNTLGYYPGTLIDLVFKTDVSDIFDIVEEDFSWDDW